MADRRRECRGFAQVCWEDLKQFHITKGSSELDFDRMIDEALEGVSPRSNLEYIQRMQDQLEERFGERRDLLGSE